MATYKTSNDGQRTYYFHGKPRIDATEGIILRIIPLDGVGAEPKNPYNCVAARALCRQEGVTQAAVGKSAIHVLSADETYYIRYSMPPSLKKEAHGYDRGGTFMGGDFQLSPFPPSKKLGIYQGTKTRPAKRNEDNKRKPVRHTTAAVRERP